VGELMSVWGSGPSSVWAASSEGQVIRWDGASWTKVADRPSTGQFSAPFGTAGGELWIYDQLMFPGALGKNELYRWDGTRWRGYRLPGTIPVFISAIAGSVLAPDVWAFGSDGATVYHLQP
jgi:hypothetical protein